MRLAVLSLLALAAPARADEPELDVPGRDSTELRGDAYVWEDGAFYAEPWEGGAMVRFSSFSRTRAAEVGRAIPVKIVSAARRELVEIELVEADTCAARKISVDDRLTGLRLFVKRTDLAPVLTQPFTLAHANGTSARLAAGVPVAPTASGAYVVSARGDLLQLPIPHTSVGYTYARTRVVDPPPPTGTLWRLDRTTTVEVGDTEIEARAGWLATRPAKHGDTVNLRWRTRCIDLVVAAPARHLVKHRELRGGGGVGYGFGRGGSTHEIPRGTPLATTSGREVAVAARAIAVPPPTGGKACFEALLAMVRVEDGGRLARTFRLCAPADAVDGPPVETVLEQVDPYAPPADVAAPPPDARRTAKGVYYKRLRASRGGTHPTADDTVVVHYTGWTTDGKMFDSSLKRGEPARFPLRALIAGWTDGLQVMAIGDKVRFWIPEELAYKGSPHAPQGMLVFDVELLGID